MKTLLQCAVLLLLTSLLSGQAFGQIVFYTVTFEDGDPNAGTYTPDLDLQCSSSRYFGRFDDSEISTNAAADYIGEIGTKYWAGEAHDDVAVGCPNDGNQPNAKSIVFGPINIAGKTALEIRLYLAANSSATDRYECDDRIDITYAIDGGGTQTAFSFRTDESPATCAVGGTPEELRQDRDLNGTGDVAEPALGQTFQQFQAAIAGTGNNITVTVTFDNDAQTEEMALDQLELLEDSALPVELVSFEALVVEQHVKLNWATATEANNSGFEVQRSNDAQSWAVLGFVEGKGTSDVVNNYEYLDAAPFYGTNHYRLKQVDFDGSMDYSHSLEVALDIPGQHALSGVYPNPFRSSAQFSLSLSREQYIEIDVLDLLGRRVQSVHSGILPAVTSHRLHLDADEMPSGVYLLRVQGDAFYSIQRIVLLD